MALPYDPASQVTQILHQLQATSVQVNKAEYLYNAVGNRTSLTDRRGLQAFGYDPLDRLTSASHPLLGTPQAFAYDPVGNRTTGGSVVNAGNQLTADATHAYQYDDNGNLTRKTLLVTGNYSQYTYDAENRLTTVEDFVAGNPTPAFTSTYRYDGLGRRIEKVTPTGTRRYIYDGEDILLEYDGSNVLQARYTHGPSFDEPIAVTKGSSTYFYHQDGLGTVTELTDSTGAVAKAYAYDAHGNIVDQPGIIESPYSYTGREFDSENGLYYYRERHYDPASGRFLQQDPVGLAGGLNLYSYVEGNPSNFIDPKGYYQTEPDGLAPYNKNTIICDGKGGITTQLSPNMNADRLRCGVRHCQLQHELSHLGDAMRANAAVCVTRFGPKPERTLVRPSTDEEAFVGEIKGYGVEGKCLAQLARGASCDCKGVLDKEIGGVGDKETEYRTKLYNLRRR